jgi:hypothetical protein
MTAANLIFHFAVTCPALIETSDGEPIIYTNGTNYDSVGIFQCTSGFQLLGSVFSICGKGDGSNGQWIGTKPTCNKRKSKSGDCVNNKQCFFL